VCGIAGSVGRGAADAAVLAGMSACIAHRGPDGEGSWLDPSGPVGFAHRRLAVLGLGPEGHQPMASTSGRFVLVHNGEIYNHLELRARLEREGRAPTWQGGSDTETLLACVEAWGVDATLPRTVGMFAVALWDRSEGTLILARDRMGEKPLSYTVIGETLHFASQPSALERVPGFDRTIDPDALASLLRHGHVTGARGIHVGVRKLPPGTLLRVRVRAGQALQLEGPTPWWSFLEAARASAADPFPTEDPTAAVDEVGRSIATAVRSQQLADVPLGAFLSGGIDSSLIVALLQEQSTRPVRTFTIGFREDSHDESVHASAVARHLGTDHTSLQLTERDALDLVPDLPDVYDEPFADTSQLPTILVSRLARAHVTVALSGDGGDELFGGYRRYLDVERFGRLPRTAVAGALVAATLTGQRRRRDLARAILRGDAAVHRALTSVDDLHTERFLLGPRAEGDAGVAEHGAVWTSTAMLGPAAGARAMAVDTLRYLPDDILHKVDRASMSIALETRVPLLDHRVVEAAWRVPHALRWQDGRGKWVLRQLLARHLPPTLHDRPKQGFSAPVGTWLRGALRPWAEELLAPAALADGGLLDAAVVGRVWQEHLAGRHDHGSTLWPVLMFQAWQARRADPGAAPHHP